jgi:hypothetical protein
VKDYGMEKDRVLGFVREYQALKDIFKSFTTIVKKALPEDNEYKVIFMGNSETTINIKVFDRSVDILFSFVIKEDGDVTGRLDFVQIENGDNEENVLTLYFDCDGSLMENLSQESHSVSLNNKYLGDYVLTLLLKTYINMPRFRVASDNVSGD